MIRYARQRRRRHNRRQDTSRHGCGTAQEGTSVPQAHHAEQSWVEGLQIPDLQVSGKGKGQHSSQRFASTGRSRRRRRRSHSSACTALSAFLQFCWCCLLANRRARGRARVAIGDVVHAAASDTEARSLCSGAAVGVGRAAKACCRPIDDAAACGRGQAVCVNHKAVAQYVRPTDHTDAYAQTHRHDLPLGILAVDATAVGVAAFGDCAACLPEPAQVGLQQS